MHCGCMSNTEQAAGRDAVHLLHARELQCRISTGNRCILLHVAAAALGHSLASSPLQDAVQDRAGGLPAHRPAAYSNLCAAEAWDHTMTRACAHAAVPAP